MWQNKSLRKELLEEIDVSTTNQRYIERDTRSKDEMKKSLKNQLERRRLLFDKQLKQSINNARRINITNYCIYEIIQFQ